MEENNIINHVLFNSSQFVKLTEIDIKMLNPLVWAYVGDSVYEMFVRSYIISDTKPSAAELHKKSIKYVKASSQSKHLELIMDMLNEEEQDIVRRGRNAKANHLPKNANVIDYRRATAFEALVGYLYLLKRYDRLFEIIQLVLKAEV
jgi:ribonuclease-3 family protein